MERDRHLVRANEESGAVPLERPPEPRRRACPDEEEKNKDPVDAEDGRSACLAETGWSPMGRDRRSSWSQLVLGMEPRRKNCKISIGREKDDEKRVS